MDLHQREQLMTMYSGKFPIACLNEVSNKLDTMDFRIASIFLSQLKDPTITLILSIIVGWYGIDRIYLGDVGLGIFKLLTCGGVGIWWLIDLFVISDLARTKNYESLMNL